MQALGFKRDKLKWVKKTEWCYFRGDSSGCRKVVAYQPDEKLPWKAKLFSTEKTDARNAAIHEAMRAGYRAAKDGSPEATLRAAMEMKAAMDMPTAEDVEEM